MTIFKETLTAIIHSYLKIIIKGSFSNWELDDTMSCLLPIVTDRIESFTIIGLKMTEEIQSRGFNQMSARIKTRLVTIEISHIKRCPECR